MAAILRNVNFKTKLIYPQATNNVSDLSLRLWLPESNSENQTDQIAILLHGFLEGIERDKRRWNKWLKRYDAIAEELAFRGIASIFLPMPLHFERGFFLDAESIHSDVVRRLKNDGSMLYFGGHDQFSQDIGLLVDEIIKNPNHFGLAACSPKIHLVGYSLGGAAAMAAATAHQGKINSLSVLYSTWGLANISAEAIGRVFENQFGFSADDWNATISKLSLKRDSFDEAFRALIWGEIPTGWFQRFPRRVMFLHGLKDELFSSGMTIRGSYTFFSTFSSMLEHLDSSIRDQYEVVFMNSHTDHLFLNRKAQVAAMVASFVGVRR